MSDTRATVLFVDDDPDIRDVMAIALEANGFGVVAARSAEDGLRLYKQARPDIVIVDLMMEEVDSGTRFVRELRMLGDTPPVFLLSSVGDSLRGSVDYGDLGLSAVFQKPVDIDALVAALNARIG
jgi:DNA-binding response OmpR family regulator